ncbi:MAG: hypothetical protein F7B17_04430 [Desulfurococcales archaeon]|nr:hypothetical protein [Desulfurococcales archaeon]
MPRVFSLYARFRLHWGFIVRQKGGSAAQPALPIPPPTTVVGFFSEPLYTALGLTEGFKARVSSPGGLLGGPFECSRKATLAASAAGASVARVIGVVSSQEVSRLLSAPYKAGGGDEGYEGLVRKGKGSIEKLGRIEFLKAISQIFPVQAVGESIAPSLEMDLVWVLDLDRLRHCLAGELGLRIEDGRLENYLKLAAWGGIRLGSKEGLGAVVGSPKVGEVREPEIIGPGESFKTRLYVPARCVTPLSLELVEKVSMWGLDYREHEFYVPGGVGTSGTLYIAPPAPADMRLDGEDCRAYVIGDSLVAVG